MDVCITYLLIFLWVEYGDTTSNCPSKSHKNILWMKHWKCSSDCGIYCCLWVHSPDLSSCDFHGYSFIVVPAVAHRVLWREDLLAGVSVGCLPHHLWGIFLTASAFWMDLIWASLMVGSFEALYMTYVLSAFALSLYLWDLMTF